MAVRNVLEKDFRKLSELYRSFYSVHNIFQDHGKNVVKYLNEQASSNDLLVFDDQGNIKGALILVNLGKDIDGSHKLWKFRHFAFGAEKVALELLKEAEKRIRKASKTAKVELTIAESEKGMNFFLSKGYKKEGTLSNHYRWGETCFILSKSFSG